MEFRQVNLDIYILLDLFLKIVEWRENERENGFNVWIDPNWVIFWM